MKGRVSPQPSKSSVSWVKRKRRWGGGECRVDMWLCGLVSVQVMCQSDNQILSHCFRKEEAIDQKRPEMVRISLSLSISVNIVNEDANEPFLSLKKPKHMPTNIQRIPRSLMLLFCLFVLFLRPPLSLKTAWRNLWRSSCLKSRPMCAVSNQMMPSSQVDIYIL